MSDSHEIKNAGLSRRSLLQGTAGMAGQHQLRRTGHLDGLHTGQGQQRRRGTDCFKIGSYWCRQNGRYRLI